jgi:hypothetical protein
LGAALCSTARCGEGLEHLKRAAELLATAPEDDVRDGETALAMAARAARLTGERDPVSLDSLAVAQAELGRFEAARVSIRKAVAAAQAAGAKELEAQFAGHLKAIDAGERIR